MPFDLPLESADRLAAFLLVFLRMTGLIVIAPLFSNRIFPMQLRIWLGFFLALLIFPLAWQSAAAGGFARLFAHPLSLLLAAGGELALGWLIGWVASVIVLAGEFAGHLIGQEIGLSLAEVFDPVSEQLGTPTTQLFFLISALVFFACGGHHLVVLSLAGSFEAAPPGIFPCGPATGMFLANDLGGDVWALGLRMALPVILALVLVTVALGLLARAVPEMNVFIVGLGVRVLFGLIATIAILPFVADLLGGLVAATESNLGRLVGEWRDG